MPESTSPRNKLARTARALFSPPFPSGSGASFARSSIAMLYQQTAQVAPPVAPSVTPSGTPSSALDDDTWNDLMLDPWLDQLGQDASLPARQRLYQRLRTGDAGQREASLARLDALEQNAAIQPALREACHSLQQAQTDISALLFGPNKLPPEPRWRKLMWLLPLLFFASMPIMLLATWTWIGIAAAFITMVSLQLRMSNAIRQWEATLGSLQMVLRSVSLLGQVAQAPQHQNADPRLGLAAFSNVSPAAGRSNRAFTRFRLPDIIPGLNEYADWFFLANLRHYFASVKLFQSQHGFLQQCFDLCADLAADLTLAQHLQQSRHCRVQVCAADQLRLEHFVHPLLPHAAPLSIRLDQRGAFISGQNGSGKSTMLRAIGLNLAVTRAFGFAYASAASLPALPVLTSLQNEDSLLGDESLYNAELRRAQQMLASSQSAHPGIYIFDEIFRGTNHLESISAAAAVLHTLAQQHLVLASSHNLVLASLLADTLVPLCIKHVDSANGSQLALVPGVLDETNGLSLLRQRGFAPEICAKADQVATWLADYLAHPQQAAGVLAGNES